MRIRKNSFLMLVLLMSLSLTLLTGCKQKEPEIPPSDYSLYYRVAGTDTMSTVPFNLSDDAKRLEGAELALYLYDQLEIATNENLVSIIPSNVFIHECGVNSAHVMTIHFPESYYEMDNVTEILFRQAVVNTMVQIEGVDYVVFYVENQTLRSHAGVSYGLMNAATFVSDVEDAMQNVDWVDLILYYSDQNGDELIGEKTKLAYSASISIEQVIVEQLIAGPTTNNCIASIPNTVDIISVSTKDGVCYVNLDQSFLNTIADCTAEVTLYSIVNSLCELSQVKRVQIQVNGSSDYVYREIYPLIESFERMEELVADEVDAEQQEETTSAN